MAGPRRARGVRSGLAELLRFGSRERVATKPPLSPATSSWRFSADDVGRPVCGAPGGNERAAPRRCDSGPPIPSQDDGAAAPALAVASAAARPCWTACLDPAALTVELDRSAFPLCRSHEPSPGNLPRSAFA